MEKGALIDVNKIKRWFFNRKLKRFIRKANKLRELTKHKYFVILIIGKLVIVRKSDMKKSIREGKFKKGITINILEKSALYITTT